MNKNDSLIRRQRLNTAAIELFTKHPIQGTGLNNFTFSLDQSVSHGKVIVPFLQPAHNVFALLLAEVGLLGFGALFSIKYLLSKPILKSFQVGWFDTKLPWAYVMVAPIFILDHYLYTLQTGLLLMAFLPLFWKYPHSK